MIEYIKFWLAKLAAEVAFSLSIVAIIALIYVLFSLPAWLSRCICKHKNVREDRSCTAWCQDCGKNLGFIGSLNRKQM